MVGRHHQPSAGSINIQTSKFENKTGDLPMNKRFFKILAMILGAIIILMILLLAVGPFLIPITPLEGLVSAQQVATNDSKFITVPFEGTDGLDIHYIASEPESADEGPTFVLLHGSLFNAFTWNEVMDFFSEQGQVVAYDQIPYGLSEKLVAGDWAERNPYTSEAAIDQLFLLLDALGVDKVVLVGNSYGGTLAVQAALAQPERVEALILVDAAVYVQEEMPAWLLELPQVRRLGPLFARQLGQSEAFIRQTYLNPDQISNERMTLTTIHTQVEDWDIALWEYLRAWGVGTPDFVTRIPTIQQPALVITGDSDAVVPVSDSQRLDSELSNSELVVLPSCGHVPQEECPEAFEEAVGMWLSQRERK
ncbi:alpha/beta fold hydrolase [Chloroflexota bacterium]